MQNSSVQSSSNVVELMKTALQLTEVSQRINQQLNDISNAIKTASGIAIDSDALIETEVGVLHCETRYECKIDFAGVVMLQLRHPDVLRELVQLQHVYVPTERMLNALSMGGEFADRFRQYVTIEESNTIQFYNTQNQEKRNG